MNKVYPSAAAALQGVVADGQLIAVGGFGLCGIPEALIAAVAASGVRHLTVISNNAGVDDFGLGILLRRRQVRKMIASYVGENAEFERQLLSGDLEVELIPQGTLAERLRAAGAGIAAFYTRSGVGTAVAEGKPTAEFGGELCLQELALPADLALVRAELGDRHGNLVYRKTARNFNPPAAMAGTVTVAEVHRLLDPGQLDPDQVHTPGVFVHRVVCNPQAEKRVEQRTLRSA